MYHCYREISEIQITIFATNFQPFFTIYLIFTVSTHAINRAFAEPRMKWGDGVGEKRGERRISATAEKTITAARAGAFSVHWHCRTGQQKWKAKRLPPRCSGSQRRQDKCPSPAPADWNLHFPGEECAYGSDRLKSFLRLVLQCAWNCWHRWDPCDLSSTVQSSELHHSWHLPFPIPWLNKYAKNIMEK